MTMILKFDSVRTSISRVATVMAVAGMVVPFHAPGAWADGVPFNPNKQCFAPSNVPTPPSPNSAIDFEDLLKSLVAASVGEYYEIGAPFEKLLDGFLNISGGSDVNNGMDKLIEQLKSEVEYLVDATSLQSYFDDRQSEIRGLLNNMSDYVNAEDDRKGPILTDMIGNAETLAGYLIEGFVVAQDKTGDISGDPLLHKSRSFKIVSLFAPIFMSILKEQYVHGKKLYNVKTQDPLWEADLRKYGGQFKAYLANAWALMGPYRQQLVTYHPYTSPYFGGWYSHAIFCDFITSPQGFSNAYVNCGNCSDDHAVGLYVKLFQDRQTYAQATYLLEMLNSTFPLFQIDNYYPETKTKTCTLPDASAYANMNFASLSVGPVTAFNVDMGMFLNHNTDDGASITTQPFVQNPNDGVPVGVTAYYAPEIAGLEIDYNGGGKYNFPPPQRATSESHAFPAGARIAEVSTSWNSSFQLQRLAFTMSDKSVISYSSAASANASSDYSIPGAYRFGNIAFAAGGGSAPISQMALTLTFDPTSPDCVGGAN